MTDLLVKDLRLAVELASQVRAPAPFTALAQALFEEASARGRGRQDYGALVLELERKAGTVARL